MKKIISLFGLIASLLFIFGCKSPVSENEVETGSLLGTVILDGTETNNNGFIISIAGTSLIATTNSKGNFKISNVPVGKDYEVAIIYGTYTCTWKTDVEIKNHKKTDLGTFEITTDVIKKGNNALNGQDGKDGKDGTSIKWKGNFDSPDKLPNPEYLWAYYNTTDGCSYIYDGENWTLLSAKGESGTGGIAYINYILNGGNFITTPTVSTTFGNTIDFIVPEKEHNTFDGWYLTENFSDEEITAILCDGKKTQINVYAKWIPDLLIKYELNGGSFSTTPVDYCKYGSNVSLTNIIPEKEHNTFIGWYTSQNLNGDIISEISNDGSNSQITLYAKWIPDLLIKYELNGGSFSTTPVDYCKYGDEVSLTNIIPKKDNLAFEGWYTTSDLIDSKITKIEFSETVTQIILYANWIEANPITMENLQDYLSELTPNEVPYTLKLVGTINFNTLKTELCKLPENTYIDLVLPNNITSIDDYIFDCCSCLKSITIPNTVTSIGNSFFGCTGLTEIVIPDGVLSIAEGAFDSCSNLKIVSIPKSITSIGVNAFCGCSNITQFIIDKDNSTYHSNTDGTAIIETATNTLIMGCYKTSIPDTITSIAPWAFIGCKELSSITIPASVTSIGSGAFQNCTYLESVTFEDPTNWYETNNEDDFISKTNGILVDFSDPIQNVEILTMSGYWITDSFYKE